MQHAGYPDVPDDFGHWLAGFIDGEGCFLISQTSAARRRNTAKYVMSFQICVRADDGAILEECAQRTGLGTVYYFQKKREKQGDVARWDCQRKADLLAMVRLLDRFPLRAKKATDYAIWREAVIYWGSLRNPGRWGYDWGPIPALYGRLRASRHYAPQAFPAASVKVSAQLTLLK